jgi:hypothetical protein
MSRFICPLTSNVPTPLLLLLLLLLASLSRC